MKYQVVVLASALAAGGCSSGQVQTDSSAVQNQVQNAAKSLATNAPAALGDAALAAQIEAHFVSIDADSALHVAVSVKDGKVNLSGRVKSASIAERYAAAAKGVSGVTAVASTIHVDPSLPPTSEQAKDALTVTAVTGALLAQSGINALGVKVRAHDGAVTLSGSVASEALKTTMLAAAKHTAGVKSVVDGLTVKS
jgi:osmotically-inducible protein OsmY